MSSNSQGHAPNHLGYYQASPNNYYVSRNIDGPHTNNGESWFYNFEGPYLMDHFYAAAMNDMNYDILHRDYYAFTDFHHTYDG